MDEQDLLAQCEVTAGRSSGPGGQNRNKVETAIRIKHLPTGITASATERRHKEQNRKQAIFRLRVKLAIELREPMDPGEPASTLWSSRVKQQRLAINPSHQDFPALLAEAMDRLHMLNYEMAEVGKALGTTTSQLIKLLKHERDAFDQINDERESRGLKRYY